MADVYIIAEAGVNHNGSLRLAMKLVDAAKSCGADAVKFQTFKADKLVTRAAGKAGYQKKTTGGGQSQYDMLKKLELDDGDFQRLKRHCDRKGIEFLSSGFDPDSIEFLNCLGMKVFKIPSGEITNLPYLSKVGSLKRKVLLSTGMATVKEIADAIDVLVSAGTPRNAITLLQCTTEYPAPIEDVNLNAMKTLSDMFHVPVGYSDHTEGIEVSLAAAALGAVVIEKHFTLSKKLPGPDQAASLEPEELKALVTGIRKVENALGDGRKKPTATELKNSRVARKSIVAANNIAKGERFSEENLAVKRPGTGISPMRWFEVIGKKAATSFKTDELIRLNRSR